MDRSFLTLLAVLAASCCTTTPGGPAPADTQVDRAERQADRRDQPDRSGAAELTGDRSPAPDWGTSPPGNLAAVLNKEYEQTVLDLIAGATKSLEVVHFECNDDSTIDAIVAGLKAAATRQVEVHALFEADVEDNAARVEELSNAGVKAKLDGKQRYTHSKLVVADGRRVLLGSTNWSYKSIRYNNETNLLLDSAPAGAFFSAYALALWANPAASPKLEAATDQAIGLVRTLGDEDYVGTVTPLLQGAKRRIDLLVYGLHRNNDYPDSDVHKLTQELVNAQQRGVEVRVTLELSDYNETLNQLNGEAADWLAANCVKVRFDPPKTISHAKLLLVDDTAVVGSNNWGHGGFHLYHEVGAVVTQPDTLARFNRYYDSIWSQSTDHGKACR